MIVSINSFDTVDVCKFVNINNWNLKKKKKNALEIELKEYTVAFSTVVRVSLQWDKVIILSSHRCELAFLTTRSRKRHTRFLVFI